MLVVDEMYIKKHIDLNGEKLNRCVLKLFTCIPHDLAQCAQLMVRQSSDQWKIISVSETEIVST